MSLQKQIYDGARAREILENEVFQQVFKDYQAEINKQWQISPARDQEGRERLWLMQSMLQKIESMLKQTLDSGKLSLANLQHQQTLADRAKNIFRGTE